MCSIVKYCGTVGYVSLLNISFILYRNMAGKTCTVLLEKDNLKIKIEYLEHKIEEKVAVADPSYSFKWWIGDTIINMLLKVRITHFL